MTLSETAPLRRVAMKHARDAFQDQETIAREWRRLNYTAAPDYSRALDEYDALVEMIRGSGTEIVFLPSDQRTGMDSIYVRDASMLLPDGILLAYMGKPLRSGEPQAQGEALRSLGLTVSGAIQAPGRLEGGDVVWLDDRTVAIGEGYRTNAEGIRQVRALLGDGFEVVAVPLPHWHGEGEVLHLMSLLSPVDHDLAVVYSPLMPVGFRRFLLDRGYSFVEVPDREFDSMATNVLALGPRRCIMLSGNPETRSALERAGVHISTYDGTEISVKGAGGPTCLTRPITRSA